MSGSEPAFHPILFSGPMIRAILEGRKTQTRRVARPGAPFEDAIIDRFPNQKGSPFGEVGHFLWVRETWALIDRDGSQCGIAYAANVPAGKRFLLDTDGGYNFRTAPDDFMMEPDGWRVRPSIFMPRWASRLTLEVTAVRVERLQKITEEDARAEGLAIREDLPPDHDSFHPPGSYGYVTGLEPFPKGRIHQTAREAFADGWDRINGRAGRRWKDNPHVWVITFAVTEER